ncbi:hypothetical protein [Methylobacter tundripaludum]
MGIAKVVLFSLVGHAVYARHFEVLNMETAINLHTAVPSPNTGMSGNEKPLPDQCYSATVLGSH